MSVKRLTGRARRHYRIRSRIQGTSERPRLCLFISNRHLYVQVIDDLAGKTLAATGTNNKDLQNAKPNIKSAKEVGKKIAELAKSKNISKVVFDRAGYRYHGVVKSLADAAREGGLKF